MKRVILLITVLALLMPVGCAKKKEELVVATVGGTKVITVADFEEASEVMEDKYLPATDDLDGKKEFLEHMINKEIMALKADAAGYEKEEWFVNFWEKFKGPFLVANMMDVHIRQKVEITEEEIDAYFDEMHYEYTLSQIVVANEDEALRIRDEILGGLDFAEAAKKYSLGAGADRGGHIGANPVGKMHWWVEEALFDMNEGDVSQPMQTSGGWALLYLHKKRKIIPDLDRSYARNRIRAIKEKKGIQEFKAKIEKEIELEFFTDAVTVAYESLPPDIPFEDIVTYKVTRSNAPKLEIPEQYRGMIICTYTDGSYTLEDFEEIYEFLALPERPRRQYGRQNIIDIMHRTVFDKVLPTYAEERLKILEVPEVKAALDQRKEQFLVHRLYQDQIRDELVVTEREIQEHYEQNKEHYMTQEQRDFGIIVVSDQQVANEVAIKARQGQNFSSLALQHSEDPSVKENLGRTGLTAKGHYPEYDEVAFGLAEEGDVSDPVQTSRGWVVIKVEEIERGRVPTFEEAARTIRQELMEKKSDELLHEKLEAWREDYVVEIDEKNLARADLKRTRL